MKNNIFKFGFIAFFMTVLVGCDSGDTVGQLPIEDINSEEAALSVTIDDGSEVLSDLTLQGFEDEESLAKSGANRFLPDCATVTIELTDTTKNVIIDFGVEGCEVRSGHIVKGRILMSYERNIDEMSLLINYSLEDFFIDDIQFAGSRTITRLKENENGNPEYSMNFDFTVTLIDGTQVSRAGSKTREWIEGAFNGNWGDNVFLINGDWQTNFSNGGIHSTTISTSLRREASCRFFVSGVVELVRTNYSGSLSYGDGSCDNKAIFTNSEGEEIEIVL
ncbi:hypothetical protein SAMN04487910_1595 [Aquimarina amphilecti]|uniref:Lipoprotein n=1 Tax=Aquimarina amphilecti TaxID=1038014 RepID=A0A1H7M565_AQUAM|nr:hypothetical protein [Aquimarina amphilecti]SEL06249.1 hypothetical protein SAMN04487910_1595 [Aquimarina amphilecti]